MTTKEIVRALRCGEDANGTPRPEPSDGEILCYDPLKLAAADLIERLTAERDAALADLADVRSCKTCRCKSKTCKCRECHLDKNAWEWRGLPEAPGEGEKA